jgi:hypothetical protein
MTIPNQPAFARCSGMAEFAALLSSAANWMRLTASPKHWSSSGTKKMPAPAVDVTSQVIFAGRADAHGEPRE